MGNVHSNYPLFSPQETWDICTRMVAHDSTFPEFAGEIACFEPYFYDVFMMISEEHNRVKYKYYRNAEKKGIINPLYVDHYAKLMHLFSHGLFTQGADCFLLDRIFLSVKMRCSLDLFYEVEMKRFFLPLHAFGTILGRAEYGDYFVVEQNCTVGNNHGIYPTFGAGVILRPHSVVIGKCRIGDNVHISAGSMVIDRDIPDNSIVFGRVPDLIIKENRYDNRTLFFEV
ncbi:MAG: transferase [Nitrospirota bacterium]